MERQGRLLKSSLCSFHAWLLIAKAQPNFRFDHYISWRRENKTVPNKKVMEIESLLRQPPNAREFDVDGLYPAWAGKWGRKKK